MWFIDPGHAWLQVELENLLKSGIADKISEYSYINNSLVYLEKDIDAPLYLNAIKYIESNSIPRKRYDTLCHIRNYRRWPSKDIKEGLKCE